MANSKKAKDAQAEFEAEFNKKDEPKSSASDADAFPVGADGEADEPAPAETSPVEDATASPTDEGAEQVAGAGDTSAPAEGAAPAAGGPKNEQQLRSWEGRLKAKEKELADKEAAMSNSKVGDDQSNSNQQGSTDNGADGGDDSGNGTDSPDADDSSEDDSNDPAAALAADFGEDFVNLITQLVTRIVSKGGAKDGSSDIAATVSQLISELRDERQQNHFKVIASAHSDFLEVTDSPQFKDWIESQTPEDQANSKRVIDSGSSDEIVSLLTKYKQSLANSGDSDSGDDRGNDDDSSDAAEGVRSSGLRLPDAPSAGANDYAAAWNEA